MPLDGGKCIGRLNGTLPLIIVASGEVVAPEEQALLHIFFGYRYLCAAPFKVAHQQQALVAEDVHRHRLGVLAVDGDIDPGYAVGA